MMGIRKGVQGSDPGHTFFDGTEKTEKMAWDTAEMQEMTMFTVAIYRRLH